MRNGRLEADIYVDQTFAEALNRRASDIHFEPHGDGCRVLLRVDGLLQEHDLFSLEHLQRVVTRLKVLSGLPVYEKDSPMDGHLEIMDGDLPVQSRISFMPTIRGEKAVVRIFRRNECSLQLDEVGLGEKVLSDLRQMIRFRQGLVLFTGPSGSGKTTTIYALLEEIFRESQGETNIVTLEDPVERDLGFAAQTPLSRCRDMSFAGAFSSLLRQDPEVIVVGEIRDPETAQIAVRAGLTGHLVISTVHSRDSAEVFLRLMEMGVESYLVASALVGVVAQRLVRELCEDCRAEADIPLSKRRSLGIENGVLLYAAEGCECCAYSGYRGRTAIAESLQVSDGLRNAILERRDLSTLRCAARKSLSISLRDSATRLLSKGLTSPEEVFRVLPALDRSEDNGYS